MQEYWTWICLSWVYRPGLPSAAKNCIVSGWETCCWKRFGSVLQASRALQYYSTASPEKRKVYPTIMLPSFNIVHMTMLTLHPAVTVTIMCNWFEIPMMIPWILQPLFIQRCLLYNIHARRKKRSEPWMDSHAFKCFDDPKVYIVSSWAQHLIDNYFSKSSLFYVISWFVGPAMHVQQTNVCIGMISFICYFLVATSKISPDVLDQVHSTSCIYMHRLLYFIVCLVAPWVTLLKAMQFGFFLHSIYQYELRFMKFMYFSLNSFGTWHRFMVGKVANLPLTWHPIWDFPL